MLYYFRPALLKKPGAMDKFVIRKYNSSDPAPKPSESAQKKRKTKVERDRDYDQKRHRIFQSSWLKDFSWLRVAAADDGSLTNNVYCHVCREYPLLADNTSVLFIGKEVDRRDTLSAHQLSSRHIACFSKHMTVKINPSQVF